MSIPNTQQMETIKQYVFQNSRLLERQLFEYFFAKGTKQACVQALLAYQNTDGGFGNGIEPDLLCPDSSAIGAETAMFVLELLDHQDPAVIDPLLHWIVEHQNEGGIIPHPSKNMLAYPHQSWWENPDPDRVLALAGYLKKWGVEHASFFHGVRDYFEQTEMPSTDNYYGYPYFIYLKHCGETASDQAKLARMYAGLPIIIDKYADHFPLFNRAWFHAAEAMSEDIRNKESEKFVAALQEDGGIDAPYANLPWWRPLWTMDGLILLKRFNYL